MRWHASSPERSELKLDRHSASSSSAPSSAANVAHNTVAIVCGYDVHTDLREYANRFRPFLSHCDVVILSGGCTSTMTDESEAHALSMLIAGEDTGAPHPRIVLEEGSMTTLDNILLSRAMVGGVTQYVVICDRVH